MRYALSVFLMGCICLSGMYVLDVANEYVGSANEYMELAEFYEDTTLLEEETPSILFETMKEINDDYIGWLSIPGTDIQYPVVQGSDNTFYLTHSFRKEQMKTGSIFTDSSIPAFEAQNTVLYGHNMKDGSMFGGLKKYKKEAYFKEKGIIELITKTEKKQYRIYSVYEKDAEQGYTVEFASVIEKQKYIERGIKRSLHKPEDVPDIESNLLTLSTCSGSQRLVVEAYELSGEDEKGENDDYIY